MTRNPARIGELAEELAQPVLSLTDVGVQLAVRPFQIRVADGGRDAGTDAGTDAGYDAGAPDAGCRCYRNDGGCPIPPDFPPDASGTFYEEELCYCQPNDAVFCADETTIRCFSWACSSSATLGGAGR